MRSKVGVTANVGRYTFQFAASLALPRCPAGRSPSPGGWVGGVYPSAQIQGADSGFRRTACIHPRRA